MTLKKKDCGEINPPNALCELKSEVFIYEQAGRRTWRPDMTSLFLSKAASSCRWEGPGCWRRRLSKNQPPHRVSQSELQEALASANLTPHVCPSGGLWAKMLVIHFLWSGPGGENAPNCVPAPPRGLWETPPSAVGAGVSLLRLPRESSAAREPGLAAAVASGTGTQIPTCKSCFRLSNGSLVITKHQHE